MGGTNVARAVGMGWAVFTGLVDVMKGIFAVWLARDLVLPGQIGVATSVSATCVVVGHNWSLFATLLTASIKEGKLRLIVRGGKGAATAFGAMLMIQPFQILGGCCHRRRSHRAYALCLAWCADRLLGGEYLADLASGRRGSEADIAAVCGRADGDDSLAPLGQCAAPAGRHRAASGRIGNLRRRFSWRRKSKALIASTTTSREIPNFSDSSAAGSSPSG